MTKCSFCGNDLTPGTGMMYAQKDAKIFYFCSKKCEKNMLKLGRKPNVTNWSSLLMKRAVKQAAKPE